MAGESKGEGLLPREEGYTLDYNVRVGDGRTAALESYTACILDSNSQSSNQ